MGIPMWDPAACRGGLTSVSYRGGVLSGEWLKTIMALDAFKTFTENMEDTDFCDWGNTVVHPNIEQYLVNGKTYDGGGCPTKEGDCHVDGFCDGCTAYQSGWNFTSGDNYHVIKCPTAQIAADMATDLARWTLEDAANYRNSVYHAYYSKGVGGGTFEIKNGSNWDGKPVKKTAGNLGKPCFWHKNYFGKKTKSCTNVDV